MPDNISDALESESIYRDIIKQWQVLPKYVRAQEILCGSEYYQSVQAAKHICECIDEWKQGI